MPHASLFALQKQMAAACIIPAQSGILGQEGFSWLSLDSQYSGNQVFIGGFYQNQQGQQVRFVAQAENKMPYYPGLFCFREGPPLRAFVKQIALQYGLRPHLIVVDGHGTAHPRALGLAAWLGIELQMPVLGCAKKSLLPKPPEVGLEAGAASPVLHQGQLVGYVWRSKSQTKPLFVSAGHLLSQEEALAFMQGQKRKISYSRYPAPGRPTGPAPPGK
ncbi:MAG: endonuclease V [Microscillaceae bacterium]|nr:endonuclease V [Microscillaceae bacterium]